MSLLNSTKQFIHLGSFITGFFRDYQDEIDEEFVNEMSDILVDFHIQQSGEVPSIFLTIKILDWEDEGVWVREKSTSELLDKTDTALLEKTLSRLMGLNKVYTEKFSDIITETLLDICSEGDEEEEDSDA